MLTPDELDDLAEDLLSLIWDRAADLVHSEPQRRSLTIVESQQLLMLAALHVHGGILDVGKRVTLRLDERARELGLSHAAIGRARGQSPQASHSRGQRLNGS